LRRVFTRAATEHPIEVPVYVSATQTLSAKFTTLVQSGELGLVTTGDIFMFKSELLIAYVHVIAMEPNLCKIQVRGLEYRDITICHRGESRRLDRLIDSTDMLGRSASRMGLVCVFDLRSLSIPLEMYDITCTNLERCFIGCDPASLRFWFYCAFCIIASEARQYLEPISADVAVEVPNESLFARLWAEKMGGEPEAETVELVNQNWSVLSILLFVEEGRLNLANLVDMFKGNFIIPEELAWLNSAHELLMEVFMPTIQKGVGFTYLASAGTAPSIHADATEIIDFINDFDTDVVVTTIESSVFRTTFFDEVKTILILELVNERSVLMRLSLSKKYWAVFKMKQEWIRALWNHEFRDLLFYGNDSPERLAIQRNSRLLNNLIVQACDPPIGYPAYVSGIIDSLTEL
jgi:hypothetical protein